MRLRRLEGEAIRDAILAVSGGLDRRQFGPSVPIHLTAVHRRARAAGQSGPLDGAGRRSIYLAMRRNFLSPMMLAFDMPIPSTTVGRRNVSNVPAQALILMNDPFVDEQARLGRGGRWRSTFGRPSGSVGCTRRPSAGRRQRRSVTPRSSFLQQQAEELEPARRAGRPTSGPGPTWPTCCSIPRSLCSCDEP